jgi:type III pantothenate kinase
MRSGIVLGCAATIDGIVEKIEQELGYPCTVVSTGGHANIVIPYCKRQIIVDEKLLLKGLMILYRKNA